MSKRKVLLLETQLDNDPGSPRCQKEFMRYLGKAHGGNYITEFIAKEVHSRSDLCFFLNIARRDKRSNYLIHFVGHGESDSKLTYLQLTNGDKINLSDRNALSIFRDLGNAEILLSCCRVGNDSKTLDRLREISKARAIFAYNVTLYDYQAFLIDAMLYHLILGDLPRKYDELPYDQIGRRVQDAIEQLLLYRKCKKVLSWSIQC